MNFLNQFKEKDNFKFNIQYRVRITETLSFYSCTSSLEIISLFFVNYAI